jgi:hypothetical protein
VRGPLSDGIAAAILLGGTAHFLELSRRAVLVIVPVIIFFASVFIPDKIEEEQ